MPRGMLPFGLARQAHAGPARKRIGFVEADVHHRCLRVERQPSTECKSAVQILGPVQRPLPTMLLHRTPALGQPQQWIAVTTLSNELAILAIGYQPIGQRVRRSEEPTSELQSLMRISYAVF